jgi:HAD superfamily hydrolase (TIGR01509 family)
VPVRAVLFDAFGTVIHPEPEWEALRTECLAIVHGTWTGRAVPLQTFLRSYETARAEQHAMVERGLREFDFAERFANTIRSCGASRAEATAWGPVAAEKYHRFQQALIHAYDAPGPTLARLKRDGMKLALVSNYAHAGVLHDALLRLGIREPFDALVVSGDVGFLKPHPRIFEVALETLGVARAEDAVMVGNDVPCDITGAKRAGLRTIWTPYPRESPPPARHPDADAVVERLAEIPDLLAKLG